MSNIEKPTAKMSWFYFVWQSLTEPALAGTQILPMDIEKGFDLLYAHNWIEHTQKSPGMITFFREVTELQVAQFKIYTDKVNQERGIKDGPKFSLIQGGKHEST